MQSKALHDSRRVKEPISWTGGQSEVEFNRSMACRFDFQFNLSEENFFLMLNVCPMCEESTWGEVIFMLYLSCFAKGVSWGLDSSLSFFGAKSSLPTSWRAFLAIRLVFFFLKSFLIWFSVDVASLLPTQLVELSLVFPMWCSFFGSEGFFLLGLPSPNISSSILSPREARAPIAIGIPICFRSGKPLEMSAGGIANPPLFMVWSLFICIWCRILSSSPFPNNAGSKLSPASA